MSDQPTIETWCGLSPSGELSPITCSHTPAMAARRVAVVYGPQAQAQHWRLGRVRMTAIGEPIPYREVKERRSAA